MSNAQVRTDLERTRPAGGALRHWRFDRSCEFLFKFASPALPKPPCPARFRSSFLDKKRADSVTTRFSDTKIAATGASRRIGKSSPFGTTGTTDTQPRIALEIGRSSQSAGDRNAEFPPANRFFFRF
jgi:hypothetical protein